MFDVINVSMVGVSNSVLITEHGFSLVVFRSCLWLATEAHNKKPKLGVNLNHNERIFYRFKMLSQSKHYSIYTQIKTYSRRIVKDLFL